MKILVTGATGFIGRHVVSYLVQHNFHVISTGRSVQKAQSFPWIDKVTFIQCDYFNETVDFYSYFGCPDLIIHCAWRDVDSIHDILHIEENLFSEIRFIRNFFNSNIKKIVVIGTCLEYGLVNGRISEDDPTFPVTPYGIAKDTLRRYIEVTSSRNQKKWNWIRLFYQYGEGQNPKSLVPLLKEALFNKRNSFPMSGGEQLRDYLPVEKVAEYICRIALQKNFCGIINCCSGTPISVRKLVENLLYANEAHIHLKLGFYPYPLHEPMAFWGNDERLMKIINEEQ